MAQPQEDPRLLTLQQEMEQIAAASRTEANLQRNVAAQGSEITESMVEELDKLTNARTIQTVSSEMEMLEAQNKTIRASQASGGVELQTELLADMRSRGEEIRKLQAKIEDISDDEVTGIGFLDTLINEFRSATFEEQLDAKRDSQRETLNQVQAITTGTETVAKEAAQTMEIKTAATIEAKANEIAALSALDSHKMKLENLHSNADLSAKALNMDITAMNLSLSAYKLDGEAADRKMREAQHTETMRQIKKGEATDEQLVELVRRGQALLGHPRSEPETILYQLNQARDTENVSKFSEFLDVGIRTVGDDFGGVISNSPYKARKTYAVVDESGVLPATKGTEALSKIENALNAAYASGTVKPPKDEGALQAEFDRKADEIMAAAAAEIPKEDASNPYQAPSMVVLADSGAVQAEPLWKNVLAPLGMKETDPQLIADHAAAAIADGSVTVNEAARGITTIFKTAAVLNNTMYGGYRRVGLPNQTSYKTRMKFPKSPFQQLVSGSVDFLKNNSLLTTGAVMSAGLLSSTPAGRVAAGAATLGIGPQLIPDFNPSDIIDLMDETQVRSLLIKYRSSMLKTPAPSAVGE